MNELTVSRQEQAALIHNRILANGQIAAQALVAMCKDLKQMRDEKLYEELHYSSFEDYAEQACGIKQRQAYSYISAYERLGADYIEQNAELGITKLELISQVSSYEREEFLETVDVEDASTRELKDEIQKWKNQVEQLSLLNKDLERESGEKGEDLMFAKDKLKEAQAEIERLKSQPTPVAIAEADEETIKKAVAEAKEKDAEVIKKLKQQLKDEKAKAKSAEDAKASAVKEAKEKANKKANERIDKLIAEGKEKDIQLQNAIKAAKVANADEDVIAIRFLFSELQSTANKIVSHLANIRNKDEHQADKLSTTMADIIKDIITEIKSK